MYGWRGKIGVMVPAHNTTMEPELNRMCPQGVGIYASRMKSLANGTIESLVEMEKHFEKAAEELASAEVDVILFGCTSGSFIKGRDHADEIIGRIEMKTRIKATTTTTSVIDAIKELNISRVSVATPYTNEVNEKEKEMLEANGIEVLRIKGLGCTGGSEIDKTHPISAYKLAKEVNVSDADGVFISCTAFRTIEIIEALENDLRKPVISSNTASLWKTLRMIGVQEPIRGYGKLLAI